MTLRARWILIVVLTALFAASCEERVAAPRTLRVVRIHNDPDGVFLNETLVFQFSERLDPSSVSAASVRISDAQGRPARGEFEVFDRRVHFVPAPVRAPDLSDGGLRPSARYTVSLAGFPELAGLRSAEGAPLEHTLTFEFQTVDPAEPRTGYVFEDASPTLADPIALAAESSVLAPDEPIVFEGLEPVDPQSIDPRAFRLRKVLARDRAAERESGSDAGAAAEDQEHEAQQPTEGDFSELIELDAYLVDNRPPDPATGARRTLLHLVPTFGDLTHGTYELYVPLAWLGLTDFSGNPVTISGIPVTQTFLLEVPDGVVGGATGSYREDFLSPGLKSGQLVVGADGTASWSFTGRCELAYPRAAGDGSAGPTELQGVVALADLQATTISVPAGRVATLVAGFDTVVLRSQGSIEIAGRLTRSFGGDSRREYGEPLSFGLPLASEQPGDSQAPEGSQVPAEALEPRPAQVALSDWLAAAQRETRGWTVIVAGGDISVPGELTISGGVLLVAGGRIRVSGTVKSTPGRPDWDPYRLDARSGLGGPDPVFQEAGEFLFLDPPLVNVLQRPLTYSVLSGPVPRRGRAVRWDRALVGGQAGDGSFAVRFLDARHPGVELGDGRAVDQPAMLEAAPSVRFLVELQMSAGPAPGQPAVAWNPPYVDFVELSWHPSEAVQ